ncbi:MAG TPA: helix-turn-helix transcriptional regulator [Candidatus Limnocylindria bacterium]|jgi:transcriptional regulator with XRE-family HTH domain|nr:helix-turn-helix transcriptional regulator [Candidatus Limnocylindria bacterium]
MAASLRAQFTGSRELLKKLASQRVRAGLSQAELAERMRTSQSAIARLEAGSRDVKISTVFRYAMALGERVEWRFVNRVAPRGAKAVQKATSKRRPVLDRLAADDPRNASK